VQRQQQPDALGGAVAVDEQVGRLADPVGRGRPGQLDAGRPVEVGQQRLGGVAVGGQPGGQVVQGLLAAVWTGAVLPVEGAVVELGAAVTLTALAPL
jgi:hypothetical protein